MSILLAVLIAVLQGVTELFPVSSLGHAVIFPAVLHLGVDERSAGFLPFLVVLHVGTAMALLAYFWRDWFGIASGLAAREARRRTESRRTLALVIVATLPAVILGGLFKHRLEALFGAPTIAAGFLILNGFLLYAGEKLRRRVAAGSARLDLESLSFRGALVIGLWQCTAFFPGLSRSGATMVGGLLSGLSHRAAAHFSFLIATPVILGAAVLTVPQLIRQGGLSAMAVPALIGGGIAGLTAYASIAFLMHYFRKHDFEALAPFAWYCWAAGAMALAALLLF